MQGQVVLGQKMVPVPVQDSDTAFVDFNDFVHDSLSSKDAYTLQKLQNSAFRSILRVNSIALTDEMHDILDIPQTHHLEVCVHLKWLSV